MGLEEEESSRNSEEYAYKDEAGRWVPGFPSRKAAIGAGLLTGATQVVTAKIDDTCPSYFARFEAKSILQRMISGLEEGEKLGKLVGGKPAQEFLTPIASAMLSVEEGVESTHWDLRVDLMNRLQDAVELWIAENDLRFDKPKFVHYGSEELHVSGPNIDISIL